MYTKENGGKINGNQAGTIEGDKEWNF